MSGPLVASVTRFSAGIRSRPVANGGKCCGENYGNSQGLGLGASPFYTSASATDAVDGNALASFLPSEFLRMQVLVQWERGMRFFTTTLFMCHRYLSSHQ